MWQTYESVHSIDEALQRLHHYGDRARIIAGGTDLLLELEQRKRPTVDVLIDITRVPDLDAIQPQGETITLGALVNHNHVVANPLIRKHALPLAQACWEVGAPQIRNRATVAGNVITGSPANDTITPLMALGASVTLASVQGERIVPLPEFYTGNRQTVMRPDEMLTAIQFPALQANERGIFLKLGLRRAQAIAVVNIAAVLRLSDDERIASAVITLGSVAPTIVRVPAAEAVLAGQALTDDIIHAAAHEAAAAVRPIDDVRSTAAYRREMVTVLVAQALRSLKSTTQTAHIPQNPAMLWNEQQARVSGSRLAERITHEGEQPIQATVNGKPVQASGQHKTLLHWLRDDLGLVGSKEGCSEGECGACTVWLDDTAVMACMVPAPRAHGAHITTVEGLQQEEQLHPLQAAFIDAAAVQCGYCTPGLLMSGAKLLQEHPQPTEEQIQQSISGNLCRCTGYYKIVQAFQEADQQANKE